MKRLFCVSKPNGKMMKDPAGVAHHGDGVFYTESKSHAKEVRDYMNKQHPTGGYYVSRGPDHIGKHSGYRIPRMRRQPK